MELHCAGEMTDISSQNTENSKKMTHPIYKKSYEITSLLIQLYNVLL